MGSFKNYTNKGYNQQIPLFTPEYSYYHWLKRHHASGYKPGEQTTHVNPYQEFHLDPGIIHSIQRYLCACKPTDPRL